MQRCAPPLLQRSVALLRCTHIFSDILLRTKQCSSDDPLPRPSRRHALPERMPPAPRRQAAARSSAAGSSRCTPPQTPLLQHSSSSSSGDSIGSSSRCGSSGDDGGGSGDAAVMAAAAERQDSKQRLLLPTDNSDGDNVCARYFLFGIGARGSECSTG